MKTIILALLLNLFLTINVFAQVPKEENFLYQDAYGKYYIQLNNYSVLRNSDKQIIGLRYMDFSLTAIFNQLGREKVQELTTKAHPSYKNDINGDIFNIHFNVDDSNKESFKYITIMQGNNFYLELENDDTLFKYSQLNKQIIAFIDKQTPATPYNYLWLLQDDLSANYLDEAGYEESTDYINKKVTTVLNFPIIEYYSPKMRKSLAANNGKIPISMTYNFKIDIENKSFLLDDYTYYYDDGTKETTLNGHFPTWRTFATHYHLMNLSSIGRPIFRDRITQLIAALSKTSYGGKLDPIVEVIKKHKPYSELLFVKDK